MGPTDIVKRSSVLPLATSPCVLFDHVSLFKTSEHGGVCSSFLDINPRGVGGGGSQRGGGWGGGGGQSKIFLHFGGIFESPHFILSEIWFYPSQQMKNSTIFQKMYL